VGFGGRQGVNSGYQKRHEHKTWELQLYCSEPFSKISKSSLNDVPSVTLKMMMDEVRKLSHFAYFCHEGSLAPPRLKPSCAYSCRQPLLISLSYSLGSQIVRAKSNINEANTT